MRIFDTHCHIYDEQFKNDLENIIKKAKDNKVTYFMVPGDNLVDSRKASELSKQYDFVFAQVGFHPSEIGGDMEIMMEEIKLLAQHNNKIRAIGEIGLDYHYPNYDADLQKKWFIRQIELANELRLPIVIHSRDAFEDTLNIIKTHIPKYGFVFHCFSYSLEAMNIILKLGGFIGLDGPVTYKNAKTPKAIAENVPLERLFVETDSPYLPPVPHRGERNEPSFITNTILEIAVLKHKTFEEIAEATFINGCKFFGIEYE